MDQNRYQPPRARVDPRNREPGSIPKAVVVGSIIDIGGTTLGGIVIAFGYSLLLQVQGASNAEIERALMQSDRWSAYGLVLTAMGLVMSVLGGYQCAVIANRRAYVAPGVLSLISVAFGAFISAGQVALPELLMMSALTVASILAGASLYIRKLAEPPAPSAAEN